MEDKPPLSTKAIQLERSDTAGEEAHFRPDSLFAFDPNELGMDGWRALGLTEEQASVILNYRKSGARFYSKKDLLKVYSIGEEQIRAWEDSMRFSSGKKEAVKRPVKGEDEEEMERSFEGNKKRSAIDPFPFDPNELSKEGWTELGLSPQQADALLRYRQAGATFWKASDLLKVYVVDSALYRRWAPYVRIDREALKVPIDRVGKEALKSLPGIGAERAGRIIEYRKLLGGFHRKEQLREVYGIPDSLLPRILERVKVEGGHMDPIPMDTSTERLMRHPYIDPSEAERIWEYRERYGAFEEKGELKALDLLSDQEYRKIAPYLELPSDER